MRVLSVDETMTHARLGALNVAWWREAPTLEQVAQMDENIDRSAPFVFVNIVLRGTPHFGDTLRVAVQELCENEANRTGLAHVVLMKGLAGSAVRMFLHGASRHCENQVVLSSLSDAVPWIVERLAACDELWTEGEVLAALSFQEDA